MAIDPSLAPAELLVAQAGESEILARILPRYLPADRAEIGPGDDAAVMINHGGRYVVTTDMMIHGPDFRLAWSRPYELGWKGAVSNLADVYAMGARPTGLVVAIAATPETPVRSLELIADGLRDACARFAPGSAVVGGDLSVSQTLTISITAFGDMEEREPVLRSGARVGDRVALAGKAGEAARGLDLLFRRAVDARGVPDAHKAEALRLEFPGVIEAQTAPEPPLQAGIAAARAGATAMMDVSDGLTLDAARMARASGVRIDLRATCFAAEDDLWRALRGGEDHALLATFAPETELPESFREIGWVCAGSGISLDGEPVDATIGWDPYTQWSGAGG